MTKCGSVLPLSSLARRGGCRPFDLEINQHTWMVTTFYLKKNRQYNVKKENLENECSNKIIIPREAKNYCKSLKSQNNSALRKRRINVQTLIIRCLRKHRHAKIFSPVVGSLRTNLFSSIPSPQVIFFALQNSRTRPKIAF